MKNIHYISSDQLDIETINKIITEKYSITLSSESRNNIVKCRQYLDKLLENNPPPIYGINTGFGSLCNKIVAPEDYSELQENIVKSHACGVGEMVIDEIVKIMLLLKIQSLSYGKSGVSLETVERLIYFFNNNVFPIIYNQGSLGASGDLVPLAHLSLPLIGEGEVKVDDVIMSTVEYNKKAGLFPLELKAKEGLALLNGTQFMSAYGVYSIIKAIRLIEIAEIISALSIDAFNCRTEPFSEIIQLIRLHKGQLITARKINKYLRGSENIKQAKSDVQDPYSFRCIPQVHGAVRDTLSYVSSVIVNEINSVTDNPIIFCDDDNIVSAGNFHGEPLALVFDFFAIAMSELGSISERRTYQLISGKRGLPQYLILQPGLNSGFMIPQYVAASLVSQNKQLCTPSSVDSIESSCGQEDHVSMGANAATKLLKVIDNVEKILAIELFTAAQAFEFRRPNRTSPILEEFLLKYRENVKFIKVDRIMYPEINKTIEFIRKIKIS